MTKNVFYVGKCSVDDCTNRIAFSRCSTCCIKMCKDCFEEGKGRAIIKGKCSSCVPRTMYSFKLLVEKPITTFNFDPVEFEKRMEYEAKSFLLDKMEEFYGDEKANPRVKCKNTKRRTYVKKGGELEYTLVKKDKVK